MIKFGNLGEANSLLLYEVECEKDGQIGVLMVEANNRTQADALVRGAGYEVRGIKCVG